ncbi:MAG: hypothetical protein NTW30_04955 [Candidatus Aenigmarchaeota archaeon]|nr:hypothetical protein [Candidatus Aenigmarchaeota archaeon]
MEKVIKSAESCGEDSGSMDIEFVNSRRKMMDAGKTEGEAVLEYLKQNESKHKPKKASVEEDIRMSKFLGRPI